jgi:hypothetical protein
MNKSGAHNFLRRGGLLAVLASTIAISACGGGGGGGDAAASAATASSVPVIGPGVPGNSAPTIKATVIDKAHVGSAYVFAPEAGDADGDPLAFSIQNKPAWAEFNTTTGALSGTPAAQHIGSYKDVTISVSDGKTQAALPPFAVTVAPPSAGAHRGVELAWTVPTTTMEGETLSDLTGFRVLYGTSEAELTQTINLDSSGWNTYAVQGLAPGTYYFAVRAVTAAGVESDLSNVVSITISG